MTRAGEALRLYGIYIEERPFSRFSKDADEQAANSAWCNRGMKWAEEHVNEYGHWDGIA